MADDGNGMGNGSLTTHYSLTSTSVQPVADTVRTTNAVAFSVAGEPCARRDPSLFTDSGRRYEFTLTPQGSIDLSSGGQSAAFSNSQVRRESSRNPLSSQPPKFSMVAANGGRVFAKEAGAFSFYLGTMEHADVWADPEHGQLREVRNAFFALDPEFNRPNATGLPLAAELRANFSGHPASERFGLIAEVVQGAGGLGFQVVFTEPRIWHWLDTRPPAAAVGAGRLAPSLFGLVKGVFDVFQTKGFNLRGIGEVARTLVGEASAPQSPFLPGGFLPSHLVEFQRMEKVAAGAKGWVSQPTSLRLTEFKVAEVAGIGVGHVHLHESYEAIYGGELQPLMAENPLAQNERLYSLPYRFFNGPVRDADGFIDGTCNYYVLCRLDAGNAGSKWRLLFTDEQTFFAGRWRLVHPTRDAQGMTFALVADLASNAALYDFNPALYWDPLEADQVDGSSRLAVSRQVLLVTSKPKAAPDGDELYSINFSWASCDRTWRWRKYPKPAVYVAATDAEQGKDETPATTECVFPQSVRLREDMTIVLKGTCQLPGGLTRGRYFQRYLPADNAHAPPFVGQTQPGLGAKPAAGFDHPWSFLPEQTFQKADQFSHFGVYAPVNSRSQYYRVELDAEARKVLAGVNDESACWEASPESLFVNTSRLNWHAIHPDGSVFVQELLGVDSKTPWKGVHSLYESGRGVRLKLLDRGELGWIAVFYDKRDDDLVPFSGLPRAVTLTLRGHPDKTVRVVLRDNVQVTQTPVAQAAKVSVGGPGKSAGKTQVTVELESSLTPWALVENLWRVRCAALDGSGAAVPLFTIARSAFVPTPGTNTHVAVIEIDTNLAKHLTQAGRLQDGTSVWLEDVVGHVAPPEVLTLST